VTIVVSDTSAISALLHIGEVEVLRLLYDRVIIPRAVEVELRRAHQDIPEFIDVHEVGESPRLEHLRAVLDEGEACAIALARLLQADLLLIDEKKGRLEAERLGLRYIGLVGVLVEAKRCGVLQAVRPILDRLVDEAGFRLAPALRSAVLLEVKEL